LIPLQSVALRTGCGIPCGTPRPPGGQRAKARRRFHSQENLARRHQRFVNRGSLAFTPVRWALLIGSRPGTPPLRRRIGSRGPCRRVRPEGRTQRWDSSHGVHHGPFADMTVSCVHSRLDRRPDFGPGLPRPGLVPFLPFLPAPTVSSAEARPESRTLDSVRVCCTPQPALGFALFPAPFHLAVATTRRSSEPFPVAKTLRSFSLSGSLTLSSPPLLLADSGAFTEWRSLSPLGAVGSVSPRIHLHLDLKALFHRRVRCVREALPLRDRSMLPWAFGSNTFRCLPRVKRWTEKLRPFPRGSNSVRGSRISREGWGRQSLGFVWLRAGQCWDRPEGRSSAGPVRCQPEGCCASDPPDRPPKEATRIGPMALAGPERLAAAAPHRHPERFPLGVSRRTPRGESTVPVRFTRRCSVSGSSRATPKSSFATQCTAPKGWAPVVELAGLRRATRRSACEGRATRRRLLMPEGMVVGAPHDEAPRRTLASNPHHGSRKNRGHGRVAPPEGGVRLVAPVDSSKLDDRPRARQTSSPWKPAGTEVPSPTRKSAGRRLRDGGAVVAAQLARRRSSVTRCRSIPCRNEPELVPCTASRSPLCSSLRGRRSALGTLGR